jgi:hypothetical protein
MPLKFHYIIDWLLAAGEATLRGGARLLAASQ